MENAVGALNEDSAGKPAGAGGNLARRSRNVLAINRDRDHWIEISRWTGWTKIQPEYPRSDNSLAIRSPRSKLIDVHRHPDYSKRIDSPRDCIAKRLYARDWLCHTPLDTINMDRCRARKLANQPVSNWSPAFTKAPHDPGRACSCEPVPVGASPREYSIRILDGK